MASKTCMKVKCYYACSYGLRTRIITYVATLLAHRLRCGEMIEISVSGIAHKEASDAGK